MLESLLDPMLVIASWQLTVLLALSGNANRFIVTAWACLVIFCVAFREGRRQRDNNTWNWDFFSQPSRLALYVDTAVVTAWLSTLRFALSGHLRYEIEALCTIATLSLILQDKCGPDKCGRRQAQLKSSSWNNVTLSLQGLFPPPSESFFDFLWRAFIYPWLRPPPAALDVSIVAAPGQPALYTAFFSSDGKPLGSWPPVRFSVLSKMHMTLPFGPAWPAFPSHEHFKNHSTDVENVRQRGKNIEAYLNELLPLPECLPALTRAGLPLPQPAAAIIDAIHATTNAHAMRKAAHERHTMKFIFFFLYEDWLFFCRTGHWPKSDAGRSAAAVHGDGQDH